MLPAFLHLWPVWLLGAVTLTATRAWRIERGSRPYDDTASFSRVRDDGCEISGVRRVHDGPRNGRAA